MKNQTFFVLKKQRKAMIRYNLLLCILFCSSLLLHGQIPATIIGTYTILPNSTETSAGLCVVSSGSTLIIENNATAIFNGDLIIEQFAKVIVSDSKVEMFPGSRILVKGFVGIPTPTSVGGKLTSNNSVITTSVAGQYWKGIETERINNPNTVNVMGSVYLTNDTVSYAVNAFSNFNSDIQILPFTYGGVIKAENTVFLNNQQLSARIIDAGTTSIIIGPGTPPIVNNINIGFVKCKFVFTNDFPFSPNAMVFLSGSKAVPFLNCTFQGNSINLLNTTGILAVNSSIKVEPDISGNPGGSFTYLKDGIKITNQLQTDMNSIIRNAYFWTRNSVNLSGCINPLILGNTSLGTNDLNNDYCSFFIRNCPNYKIEGNKIAYDIGSTPEGYRGIVVMNSGVGNNKIYRNQVHISNLGIQAIGTNKSEEGLTGLKILCNNLLDGQGDRYDITVMNDFNANANNGIHKSQFDHSMNNIEVSAANQFSGYNNPLEGTNYYLEPGSNDSDQFVYKYNLLITAENPVSRNFPNAETATPNTCPVLNEGSQPPFFPFALYAHTLQVLETKINDIEMQAVKDKNDTLKLEILLADHSQLIDSVSSYYQYMDDADSLLLVYQQVKKGYEYQLYLAFTYRALEKYDDAIAVLNNISGNYSISPEEELQIENTVHVFKALKWLSEHNHKWGILPEYFKSQIYEFNESDAMYAGAIARALLTEHEHYDYDPLYRMPNVVSLPMQYITGIENENKIFPNPANHQLFINWKLMENDLLILVDFMGREVMRRVLEDDFSSVNIYRLKPGMYLAQIQSGGKTVYQQKIVKQ